LIASGVFSQTSDEAPQLNESSQEADKPLISNEVIDYWISKKPKESYIVRLLRASGRKRSDADLETEGGSPAESSFFPSMVASPAF
jgi:hypothetical protein